MNVRIWLIPSVVAAMVSAQPSAVWSPSQAPLVLTGATVIDGTGAPPQRAQTVVIEGDRIADIYATGRKKLPPDSVVRDLRGYFIMPGLIDAHAHFGAAALGNGRLRRVLEGGVTGLRNMLGDCRALQKAREAASRTELPDFIYTAVMIGPAGRTDPRGAARPDGPVDPGCVRLLDGSAVDPIEVVGAARERGAAAIKFYGDVSPTVIVPVTEEAHRRGLSVWAHATVFPARPSDLVRAGVDVLSHAAYLVWEASDTLPVYHDRVRQAPFASVPVTHPAIERVLRQMAERQTVLDATLLFFHLRATAPETAAEDFRGDRNAYRAAARWGAAVTRRARALGVPVVAGTDALGAEAGMGPNLHRELQLLVDDAGFTPLQAIAAATSVASRVIRLHDSVGTVSVGKQADLVVLRADPTRDIRNTSRIAFVIKRGRIVDVAPR